MIKIITQTYKKKKKNTITSRYCTFPVPEKKKKKKQSEEEVKTVITMKKTKSMLILVKVFMSKTGKQRHLLIFIRSYLLRI